MPDVSRSNTVDADDPWAGPPPPEADPNEVTEARAIMLAKHAVYVQGGFSTPEIEAERASTQLAQSPGSIDWSRMEAELQAALVAKAAELSDQLDAEAAKESGGLPIKKLRRYKELREAQAGSEAEAKAIKEEADLLQSELIDEFAEAGVQNINVDGKTIFLHRSVYAQRLEGVDTEAVKAALIADGYGDLVTETVNGSSLNALIRELTDDDDSKGLPEHLAAVLTTGERYAVRIIAGGTKAKSKTHSKG